MSPEGGRTVRWSRQVRFPGIGEAGQERIAAAKVLVVGCGALGSAIAEMLVRAGVGFVRIVDRDVVEESNLQRQTLFTEEDARAEMPKAEAAAARLRAIDSKVVLEPVVADFSAANAADLIDGVDLAVDGTDNFPARFVLNDAAFRAGMPWIYGACVSSNGVVGSFAPPGPCLRCFLEEPPPAGSLPTCDTAGILPSLPAVVAGFEVTEALKRIVGAEPLRGLLTIETWDRVEARPLFEEAGPRDGCATCGTGEFPSLAVSETGVAVLCGRDAVQLPASANRVVDVDRIAAELSKLGEVRRAGSTLAIRIEGVAITLFGDGRCLVRGVSDPLRARALVDRWIGG